MQQQPQADDPIFDQRHVMQNSPLRLTNHGPVQRIDQSLPRSGAARAPGEDFSQHHAGSSGANSASNRR
jgi:hypothetical protein